MNKNLSIRGNAFIQNKQPVQVLRKERNERLVLDLHAPGPGFRVELTDAPDLGRSGA
jgi:hypothetical protein